MNESQTTYWGLLNATIDGGIEGARRDYSRPDQANQLAGSVDGFEACREKSAPEIVALWLRAGRSADQEMESKDVTTYWYWRCFQLEVEWTLNVLSAALRTPLLGHLPTARGVMRAAEIVGVADA